jgi:hypothetical protein
VEEVAGLGRSLLMRRFRENSMGSPALPHSMRKSRIAYLLQSRSGRCREKSIGPPVLT